MGLPEWTVRKVRYGSGCDIGPRPETGLRRQAPKANRPTAAMGGKRTYLELIAWRLFVLAGDKRGYQLRTPSRNRPDVGHLDRRRIGLERYGRTRRNDDHLQIDW